MPTIGLPKIKIAFQTKGLTAIRRSERGIVLLFVKGKKAEPTKIYTSLADVADTATGYEYIADAFLGAPNKVIVKTVLDGTIGDVLKECEVLKFDYMAFPEAAPDDNAKLVSWTKDMAAKEKTYKFVGAGLPSPDSTQIISLFNKKAWKKVPSEEGEKLQEIDASKLTARLAGIFAGLSLERSATYYVLPELEAVDRPEDVEKTINEGNIVLIDDGEKIKIARAVNTFTTYTATAGEDLSKIKIVEAMHMVKNDIADTFHDYYVGKVNNTYENKQLFFANINQVYFRELLGSVFDAEYDNRIDIDMEEQRKFCVTKGEKVEEMTEMQIKTYPTGSFVFGAGKVKFVDAMEDLYLNVMM